MYSYYHFCPCVCPCAGGTCLSYEWVTGEWKDNQRTVWCQRSDGVNVTGSNAFSNFNVDGTNEFVILKFSSEFL